jgi:hypothetical protein
MKILVKEPSRNDEADGARRQTSRIGLQALTSAGVAMTILAFGTLHGPPSALGDDDSSPRHRASGRAAFVSEVQRTLKVDDDRLVNLATVVFAAQEAADRLRDQPILLRVEVKTAEAEHRNAKLSREVAEIAVKEYTEGIYPQDLIAAEGDLRLAKSDLDRARDMVGLANSEIDKLQTKLNETWATLAFQQAESKKKVLVEYTKPFRIKELESEVAKARSEETKRQGMWELAKVRLEKAQKAAEDQQNPAESVRRILALIDRAIPTEAGIRDRLAHADKAGEFSDSQQKEIHDLVNELGAAIDEAESVKSEADYARMKVQIQRTTRRVRGPASK